MADFGQECHGQTHLSFALPASGSFGNPIPVIRCALSLSFLYPRLFICTRELKKMPTKAKLACTLAAVVKHISTHISSQWTAAMQKDVQHTCNTHLLLRHVQETY